MSIDFEVIGEIHTTGNPNGNVIATASSIIFAADTVNNYVYVANGNPNSERALLFQPNTDENNAGQIIIADSTGYIASRFGLVTFDPDTVSVTGTIATPVGIVGVAMQNNSDKLGSLIYVIGNNEVNIIDQASSQVLPFYFVSQGNGVAAFLSTLIYTSNYSTLTLFTMPEYSTLVSMPVGVMLENTYGGTLYFDNEGTIYVLDLSSTNIVGSITGFSNPTRLWQSDTTLYVVDNGNNAIYEVDTTTNAITGTVISDFTTAPSDAYLNGTTLYMAFGSFANVSYLGLPYVAKINSVFSGFDDPFGLALSSSILYVSNNGNNTVSVVDLSSSVITGIISGFDDPVGLALSSSILYVSNFTNNTVSVVDLSSSVITGIISGFDGPADLALSSSLLYVANFNTVSVVDLSSSVITGSISGFHRPNGLALSSSLLYVANPIDDTVSFFNLIYSPITTLPILANSMVVSDSTAYFADTSGNILSVDLSTNSITGTIAQLTAINTPLSFSTVSGLIYAGVDTNQIAAIDPATGTIYNYWLGINGLSEIIYTATSTLIGTNSGLVSISPVYPTQNTSFDSLNLMATDPSGTIIYAADAGASLVYLLGTSANVITSIPVPFSPSACNPDESGTILYIMAYSGTQLMKYSRADGSSIMYYPSFTSMSAPLSFPVNFVPYSTVTVEATILPSLTGYMGGGDSAIFLDIYAHSVVATIGVSSPVSMAQVNNYLYITSEQQNIVYVYDMSSMQVSTTITGITAPTQITYDGASLIYVANVSSIISIIDATNNTISPQSFVSTGNVVEMIITNGGSLMYITEKGNNNILSAYLPISYGTVTTSVAFTDEGTIFSEYAHNGLGTPFPNQSNDFFYLDTGNSPLPVGTQHTYTISNRMITHGSIVTSVIRFTAEEY